MEKRLKVLISENSGEFMQEYVPALEEAGMTVICTERDGRVLLEKDAARRRQYDEIQDLLSDRERLRRMGQDATKLAAHDAGEKIYREIMWAIEHHNK